MCVYALTTNLALQVKGTRGTARDVAIIHVAESAGIEIGRDRDKNKDKDKEWGGGGREGNGGEGERGGLVLATESERDRRGVGGREREKFIDNQIDD